MSDEDKNKNTLAIRKKDSFGNFEIYYTKGGEVPNRLKGLYTSEAIAYRAIEAYKESVGEINEKKKLKEEIKSIHDIDHTEYDDDDDLKIDL